MRKINLQLLTDDKKIIDACRRYWSFNPSTRKFNEPVSGIAHEWGLNSKGLLDLVQSNATAYLQDVECYSCLKKYQLKSRSDFISKLSSYKNYDDYQCPECGEKEIYEETQRQLKEWKEQKDKKRSIIQKEYSNVEYYSLPVETMDLQTAVYLISLLRCCSDEAFHQLIPIEESDLKLAPTRSLSNDIAYHLYKNKLISIDPDSDMDCFILNEDKVKYLDTQMLRYKVTVRESEIEKAEFIEGIESMFLDKRWPEHWKDQIKDLCQTIALHECLEYLFHQLSKRGFKNIDAGKKTIQTIENGLKHFSVSQLYSLIHRACTYAANAYVEKKIPIYVARNYAISTLRTIIERARDNEWEIKPWKRDFDCLRSAVSLTLYSSLLHLDDAGFTEIIDDITY
jgi:predicted RNA-binding Zn-ribbon protein involved in translation (DUF1610 family)